MNMRIPQDDIMREVKSSPFLRGAHVAQLVSTLVATPSVNDEHGEADVAAVIARLLTETACEVATIYPKPGRPSVGAVIRGMDGDADAVVLNGHMDTVPVDDRARWTVDPFAGTIKNGFVYGRGACDMKGGLATQIAVAQFMSARARSPRGSLVLQFAMGEERGEPGTLALLDAGYTGRFGVTTEPTELKLGIAERGLVTFRVTIEGRSSHASRPDAGDNPIRWLPDLLRSFQREDALVREIIHPLIGTATWTTTNVHAGVFASAIPDRCDLLVDRRLLPGESVAATHARCREIVAAAMGSARWSVEIEEIEGIYEAAEVAPDAEVVRRMQASIIGVTGRKAPLVGTPYSSDVRNLINDAGIESVTFGAGDVALAHAIDERISVEELEAATRCVAAFVLNVIA
jgi:succinyl-diaminopimelate desuccinylase